MDKTELEDLLAETYPILGARMRTRHLLYDHEGEFDTDCKNSECQADRELLARVYEVLPERAFSE